VPRPGPRTDRDRLVDQRRRHARTSGRRIVALDDRPDDDGVVDEVAIDYALRGWADIAARLTRAELTEAVARGVRRGDTTSALADLLLLHEREVERFRVRLRARAREAVAA
jgi:hypothetical protein